MSAYDASAWTNLFTATTGAAAALTGLVFVAVSINLTRILQFDGLPARALETILLLMSVLVVGIAGLVPGQDDTALGIELLVVAVGFGAGIGLAARRSLTGIERVEGRIVALRLGAVAAGTLPLLVGAISVLATAGGGLYWIAAGIVGAFAGAVLNAWVLLVEILR